MSFFFAERQVILKELKQFFDDLCRPTTTMTDRCHRSCDEILCKPGMTRHVMRRIADREPGDGTSKKLGRAERGPNQWVISEKMTRN